MAILPVEQRNKLERTIINARDVAEAGAKAAIEAIAVHHHEPYGHMSPEERKLRNHLRARARQLGDKQNRKGELEITHLVLECAYEHWHRMLFARFLAENNLLIEPEMGVAISIEECEELAKEEGKYHWALASELAQHMLPQIFRPDDPILKITFAREHQLKLEQLLENLEAPVFTASDSLGWVYQFWQTKHKKEVNESGVKIDADELPTVTQLFTEPYMVKFLIHNTIGSWWAGKIIDDNPELALQHNREEELRNAVSLPGVPWEYLRFVKTDNGKGPWTPAAGTFSPWPRSATKLKILDPCCGSGHFLVELLNHLVPILIAEEEFSPKDAVATALKDIIHGLEIDECCTKIAVFAIALASWTYPKSGGYRDLPNIRIACTGKAPSTTKEEWISIAGENERARNGMDALYAMFENAPTLGSLVNVHSYRKSHLFEAEFSELEPYIDKMLSTELKDYEKYEKGIVAHGLVDAVRILNGLYHLVITNVPYLGQRRQCIALRDFFESRYPLSKADLGSVMLERSIGFTFEGGACCIVVLRALLFKDYFTQYRKSLLQTKKWNMAISLGPGAFETIGGEIVDVALISITNEPTVSDHQVAMIDVSSSKKIKAKASDIVQKKMTFKTQNQLLDNPDHRITVYDISAENLLEPFVAVPQGIKSGDDEKWICNFWELSAIDGRWERCQSSVTKNIHYGGRSRVIDWGTNGEGMIRPRLGSVALNKIGVGVSQTGKRSVTLYSGTRFDSTIAPLVPHDQSNVPALWCYVSSKEYLERAKQVSPGLFITNSALTKVPFDKEYWQKVAQDKYPSGLPKPQSTDPTQWVFKGDIFKSDSPLQVAVSLMLGYSWPEQSSQVPGRSSDEDGLFCITSIKGEDPAPERLNSLLSSTFGEKWSLQKEIDLIASTGSKAKDLDEWLRDDFFEQHCKLFNHRPFIWHIWDGRRRDGFHALVNYHKLVEGNGKGRQLLENLTYSYLGDWIRRQKESIKRGEGGAEDRLTAALELQKRLIAVIEGESPFDIFVRWKAIEEQPIGWEPDINDGVRLNIRPFMAQDIPGGRKGAGILRWKPNIKWGKDRGKEPFRPKERFPWYWKDGEFTSDRVNDVHLHIDEKSRARAKT